MKSIMIAAPESNSGKTIVTCGIIRALVNRGIDVSGFKTGPDFVDRKYIELASKKAAGNLDMHMMGKEGIHDSIAMNHGEFSVIEGVMGYFDGLHNSYENSSYDISVKLDVPVVLVYSPKGEMFTIIPKVKGMVEFSKNRIKGIILNKSSKTMYELLKEQLEKHIDIKVLGYVPYDKSMNLDEIEASLDDVANLIEETVDMNEIIRMAGKIDVRTFKYPERTSLKVAIAYDEAFNLYYKENINILENITELEYFSPLKDKEIPEADLVYIGGGKPELYKDELSKNEDMVNSLRKYAQNWGYIFGEGGGLMYLSNSMDGTPMCRIIDGETIMADRLQNFGYCNILLGNYTIPAQEFHRSILNTDMKGLFTLTKPMTEKSWESGYNYKNVLGIFQHINFLGNMEAFNHFIRRLQNEKEK